MELKEQKFGIEIEMTGITRAKAAEVRQSILELESNIWEPITIPMQPLTRRGGSGSL